MSRSEREVICIVCAKGCRTLARDRDGEVQVEGALCRNGLRYVRREFRDPRRVLTSTVEVAGPARGRLPVRTRGAVPRDSLTACMRVIAALTVHPPVRLGQVIVVDIAGTGEDLVACSELPARG